MTDCHICGSCDGDRCRNRLTTRLKAIPRQYEQLTGEYPDVTAAGSENGGGRSSPLIIGAGMLDILLLRFPTGKTFLHPLTGEPTPAMMDGLESLEGFCRIVIEERDFHWPAHPPDTVGGRISVACQFLGTHLDWITTQEWVVELDDESRTIDLALRKALDPYRDRIRYKGLLCPGSPDLPCGEPLWLDRTYETVIVCRDGCGATWYPEAWETLADRIQSTVRVHDVEAFVFGPNPAKTIHGWIELGLLPNHGDAMSPRVKLAEVLDVQRRRMAV